MRKKTEELWKQALAEQTVDSDVPETFPPAAQVPECSKCANRGKLDGLSQEFYCDSCKYSKTWLDDNFAAAPEVKQ